MNGQTAFFCTQFEVAVTDDYAILRFWYRSPLPIGPSNLQPQTVVGEVALSLRDTVSLTRQLIELLKKRGQFGNGVQS